MVPLDIPNVALDMMRAFVYGASFDTNKQLLDRAKTASDSCPVCSTCDDSDETSKETPKQNTNTDTNSSVGGFVISYSWLVALLALGGLALILGVFRSRRKGNGSRALPTFDMELPESQYTDDPETLNGENGEETHEVI